MVDRGPWREESASVLEQGDICDNLASASTPPALDFSLQFGTTSFFRWNWLFGGRGG